MRRGYPYHGSLACTFCIGFVLASPRSSQYGLIDSYEYEGTVYIHVRGEGVGQIPLLFSSFKRERTRQNHPPTNHPPCVWILYYSSRVESTMRNTCIGFYSKFATLSTKVPYYCFNKVDQTGTLPLPNERLLVHESVQIIIGVLIGHA